MKKLKKISISLGMLMLATNSSYAATAEASSGSSTKYVFMAIAAVVILLLLFIGYKMDTKGDELDIPKAPKKVNKKALEKKEKIEEKYEADNVGYEIDSIKPDDINDSIEYEEDDDETLYSASNDDLSENNDEFSSNGDFEFSSNDSSLNNEDNVTEPENEINTEEEINETEEPEKTYGEEFDTSIIDGLEDEDDMTISSPKSFDETMVFNNPENDKLSKEIDELDNIDDDNNEMEIGGTASDPFIDELEKFKEPEPDFAGFSVASPSEKEKVEDSESVKENEVKKTTKKYTKTKKEEVAEDNDFLAQMEKNLEKSKEERVSKRTTRKKKE